MKGNYKFQKLQDYLQQCKLEIVELTFEEIEEILGFKLCKSAYQYSEYWHPSRTHTLPLAWQDNGYEMVKLNLSNQTITLSKVGSMNESQNLKSDQREMHVLDKHESYDQMLVDIKQILIDWCKNRMDHSKDINFNIKHCVGKTYIKFTTNKIDNMLCPTNDNKGEWGNGHYIFYEINNRPNKVFIYCVVGVKDMDEQYREIFNLFLNSKDKEVKVKKTYCIERFEICDYKDEEDIATIKNKLEIGLNDIIENQIPTFQKEFENLWREIIRDNFPNLLNNEVDSEGVFSSERYTEGALTQIIVNKYERNIKARRKCLEAYGYTCKICGENLEDKYGDLGKDFIHVHHIIPLNEIKEEYDLDPLTDLIPICPNCHAIIHRKNPAYTPNEIKAILRK